MATISSALPPGFVDILTAKRSPLESLVNIIGVVIDVQPAMCNRSDTWQVTFKVQDIKHRDSVGGEHGFTVRIFRPHEAELPSVYDHGDVVLLRNVRIREFNAQRLALSTFGNATKFIVFPNESIPTPGYSTTFMSGNAKLNGLGSEEESRRVSTNEQAYVISLKALFPEVKSVNPGGFSTRPKSVVAKPTNDRPTLKFKVIRELQHRNFADLTVEVVKKFTQYDGNCELYVTDYTINKDMFYYKSPEEALDPGQDGDLFGYNQPEKRKWPGPFGWYVLKINLKQPHAGWANQNVREGQLIQLQNVKCKVMNDKSKLEGDMWFDERDPERVQISHVRNTDALEVRELRHRKDAYWLERKRRKLYPYNTSVPADKETSAQVGPATSKSDRKKAKKQRQAAKKASEVIPVAKTTSESAAGSSNEHVRCAHGDRTTLSFEQVLDAQNLRHTNTTPSGEAYQMPFVNADYRTTARVVDFWPNELEDFVVLAEPDPEEKSEFSQEAGWESSPKWEWDFALQLEDVSGGQTLWANVGHQQAQHLLGNGIEDPSQDLHGNSKFVNQLREKMCILWGDLEEKKRGKRRRVGGEETEKPSNKPFDLCLWEYGLLAEGGEEGNVAAWEKQFAMHSVTIL